MTRSFLALLVATLLISVAPAGAHHSFAATYFDTVVTIEGDIIEFQFRNPHTFVQIMAPDPQGAMQRWAIEWGAGLQLSGEGVTRETLKPGDHVIITGNPGRTEADHRLRMRSILRPKDGWKWSGTFQ